MLFALVEQGAGEVHGERERRTHQAQTADRSR